MKNLILFLPLLLAGQEFDSHAVETVRVAMRDGVRLATDVYRPARGGQPVEGAFPTVLIRTPYNKQGGRRDCAQFAQHGYVALAQDCRGRFASEGVFYPFLNEGRDGYDAIEWAAAQPWSNGKVATYGGSYLAWDQYHAAMYRPPHLAAMFALVGGTKFYDEYAYPGGTPNLGWPLWLLSSARSSQEAARNPASAAQIEQIAKAGFLEWLKRSPAEREKSFAGFPAQLRAYRDFYAHPEFDAYWRQRGWWTGGYYGEMKDVPVMFVTGWFDYFGDGAIEVFRALAARQKSPKKLVVGPWPHATGGDTCGDAAFGPAAAVDLRALAVEWFDHWLKGRPSSRLKPEPVEAFRMGGGDGARTAKGTLSHGGAWRLHPSFPPPGTGTVRYYLGAEGALGAVPPGASGETRYRHDPAHPVPTLGGRYNPGNVPMCPQDQRALEPRPDILRFASQPLAQALEVTGRVAARLWVASDAPSADFTAKLIDVYPSGYAMLIADGQRRAQLRPGRPAEITIDLGYTSNLFAAGHRLRVDIASSNFPKFETNPRPASNAVLHGGSRPSRIELPVVAAK